MDLSGVGAKAVVALLLYGPLTVEQLVEHSGASKRRLWAGVAQAEALGLIGRQKRGRTTLYSSSMSPTTVSGLSSVESGKEVDKDSKYIYPYPGQTGDKTALQEDKMSPSRFPLDAKMSPNRGHGDKTAPQRDKMSPSQSGVLDDKMSPDGALGDKMALSPLDAIIEADLTSVPEVSNRPDSPYVRRRVAQRQALRDLWAEYLSGKPVPPDSTLDRLLREANNSAYFLAVVIQDMTATGKDIEWPIGYIQKAVAGRKGRGDIPHPPLPETIEQSDLTPELRAVFDRAEEEGHTYWRRSDDE